MPTFASPAPIHANIRLDAGALRIVAGNVTDTVVEVRAVQPADRADARAAEHTRVDLTGGRLTVATPRRRGLSLGYGAVDIDISLPAGSQVSVHAGAADVRCTGRLGECEVSTSAGDIHIDESGPQRLRSASGDVVVGRVTGDVDAALASGAARIDEVSGSVTLKNSNGRSWVGAAGGDVTVSAANGHVLIDRAGASVQARTANGDIRVGELTRGRAVLMTAVGQVEVGVREGSAALLDVFAGRGSVRSDLDAADGPAPSDETLEVYARTGYGDVVVRRSRPAAAA